ncbi:hypothetical protein E6H34_10455 [Candidatus Bathyarchaeota archaeon]|nr:MAG: hypothetical protein E6H34_10455 [Candidatus Bathyarchaeota archaeon]
MSCKPLHWPGGAFKVKRNGTLGGFLFVAAGILPWLCSLLSSDIAGFRRRDLHLLDFTIGVSEGTGDL